MPIPPVSHFRVPLLRILGDPSGTILTRHLTSWANFPLFTAGLAADEDYFADT